MKSYYKPDLEAEWDLECDRCKKILTFQSEEEARDYLKENWKKHTYQSTGKEIEVCTKCFNQLRGIGYKPGDLRVEGKYHETRHKKRRR
jgi:phage FluMu protein Com